MTGIDIAAILSTSPQQPERMKWEVEYPNALEPITWNEACSWIAEGKVASLARLNRSQAEQRRYEAALDKMHLEWSSTADFICHSVFSSPSSIGPDGKRVAAPPVKCDDSAPPVMHWRPNDYPYNFEAGIQHHLLWCNRPLMEDELQEAIHQQFPDHQTVYWVNPTVLQSVTTIWHAHILVRLH